MTQKALEVMIESFQKAIEVMESSLPAPLYVERAFSRVSLDLLLKTAREKIFAQAKSQFGESFVFLPRDFARDAQKNDFRAMMRHKDFERLYDSFTSNKKKINNLDIEKLEERLSIGEVSSMYLEADFLDGPEYMFLTERVLLKKIPKLKFDDLISTYVLLSLDTYSRNSRRSDLHQSLLRLAASSLAVEINTYDQALLSYETASRYNDRELLRSSGDRLTWYHRKRDGKELGSREIAARLKLAYKFAKEYHDNGPIARIQAELESCALEFTQEGNLMDLYILYEFSREMKNKSLSEYLREHMITGCYFNSAKKFTPNPDSVWKNITTLYYLANDPYDREFREAVDNEILKMMKRAPMPAILYSAADYYKDTYLLSRLETPQQ